MSVDERFCPPICLIDRAQKKNNPSSTTCLNLTGDWDTIHIDHKISLPTVPCLTIDGSPIASVIIRRSQSDQIEFHLAGKVYAPTKSWELTADPLADASGNQGYHVYHKTEYEICSQFKTQALILEVGLPANLKLEQLSISAKKITSEIPLVCAKQLAMSVIQNANTTVQCPRLSIFSETGQINASIISSGNTHATISSIQGDVSLILRGFSHIEAEINAPVQHHNWIISRKEKDGGGELAGRIHSNSGMVTIR